MEQDFYKERLIARGIEVVIPENEQRELINSVIFDELCLGEIRPESQQQFLKIFSDLYDVGTQGVILGCTEIGMLVKQTETTIPLFDTTEIHAKALALLAIV
ncbi:hypothetical protein Hs30E_14260 [Lactococcus hodotermopsidis]|uniref:Aspartate racemase n=1 Tax=Pseudolactococcus hodotermopsidis TaxID=2709157 RepID=A0A6A0BDW6_9LACT|nr:aspartate/glutamate racemase family protein [Lactococcus hodotermopsidis]GFH42875.1 hypothetical protein Hs30E_14260 [Lactococcus hodotermopsidis]